MAKITCAACRKIITGKYIRALKKSWHLNCFRCAACGELIADQGFLEKKGSPYHPNCYHLAFSPRCSGCGEPITGKYMRAMNKLWHPEHFVCSHCSNQIGEQYYVHKRKPYCKEDYLELFAEKCALCGQPLVESYIVDAWGNHYCTRHENDPHCSSCDRLIGHNLTGGGVRYDDNRIMCTPCSRLGIRKANAARELLWQVQKVLNRYDFQFESYSKIPVRLVGRDELEENVSKRRRKTYLAGLTSTRIETLNGAETHREISSIMALYGLPEDHLGSVLAHEMGHAWLFMNRYPVLPKKVEEGICEFFGSLWLKELDTELSIVRMKMMEKNPDIVYGRGFRSVRRAVERSSLPYVLDYVKRYAVLPKLKPK